MFLKIIVPFETLSGAEIIRKGVTRLLNELGECSVADLYDMCYKNTKPKHNRYGWTYTDCKMSVRRFFGKYFLILQRPVRLK